MNKSNDYSISSNISIVLPLFLLIIFMLFSIESSAQDNNEESKKDTSKVTFANKFGAFNKKAEKAFKILPFPMVSYSTETGTVVGLVKYNLVQLVKGDTISAASSFSELISFSTEGQFKVVFGSSLFMNDDKMIFKGGMQYVDYPEYILGVGNVVYREDLESIRTRRIRFANVFLVSIDEKKHIYIGPIQDYINYLEVSFDSSSYLLKNKYPGYKGGISSGVGAAISFDTRDFRRSPSKGAFLTSKVQFFDKSIGSAYSYNVVSLDLRYYFNPWYEHVVATQLRTLGNFGNVPFYSLGMIGGTDRMRGYYLGVIRDKVVADAQIEYRMPVWNIFGVVAFASAGRVAETYSEMGLGDLWYAGGVGLRIMVDTKNRANLRIDVGWGQKNSRTVTLGFTEAF